MKPEQRLQMAVFALLLIIVGTLASIRLLNIWEKHPSDNSVAENTLPTSNETQGNAVVENSIAGEENEIPLHEENIAPTPSPTLTPTPVVPQDFSEIVRGNTTKNQVIFTFDAGSGTQSTDAILAALEKHHVRGTFFVTGKWVEKNTALVKKIAQAGHEIFNHTYDHKDLTTLTDAQIRDEFKNTETLIINATGKTTKPYFRAPYGARNQHVRDIAHEEGYRSVFWTIDALDWKEGSGVSADQVVSKIFSNIKPGTIFLMHVGDTITGSVLDEVFTHIEQQGFRIVSLTEGIGK